MSADGRIASAPALATDLESASFVRLVVRPDGDALAAAGILARALATVETPFQVAVAKTVTARTARLDTERAATDVALSIGAVNGDRPQLAPADQPTTLAACNLARELGVTPDPVLALAGIVAAGHEPDAGDAEGLLREATERGLLERRPGVSIPTADPVDGLAHSTRLRAPWSGAPDAVREALPERASETRSDTGRTDDEWRAVASLVAIDTVSAPHASERAGKTLSSVLRPYTTPAGAFETVGGYADVLEATARVEPGTGIALAMGHDVRETALIAWREHGRQTHAALETASTGRYDGLFVLGVEGGPVESVARLAADYRSPEPVTLAIGDGEAALAFRGTEPTTSATTKAIADAVARETGDCDFDVTRRGGTLRYDPNVDEKPIIAAARDVL